MTETYVSVVVPIRNEERHIEQCLRSLLKQTYSCESYEILVVDGCSSDRSKEIVTEFAHGFSNVRFLDNHAGIVPVGMNIGIRNARGRIIIRADGHNFYPSGYIENCVKYLDNTGAENVGGPWLTIPADDTLGARLVAAMLSNPFGVGDSRFRTTNKDGFVETVPFGAYRRELFDRVGYFNEKLVRNQDNELNARIRAAGGKIYQATALRTEYHPVSTLRHLLKQTFRQSQWHVFSCKEHAGSMGLRHFVPSIFLAVVVLLFLASLLHPWFFLLLAVLMATYLTVGVAFGFAKSFDRGLLVASTLPLACLLFHLTYGLGTLFGLRYLFSPPSSAPIRVGGAVCHAPTEKP